MLNLQNIQIIFSEPVMNKKDVKFIRLSLQKMVITSKQYGKVITSQKLEFVQMIKIPKLYNKPIQFQIFTKHAFGFNPQQLQQIYFGEFTLQQPQKYKQTEVKDNKSQVIGKLCFSIRTTSIISNKVGNIYPINQKLLIKSMIAHLPNLKSKKSYIVIKVGQNTVQTPIVKSRGGQLVFIQPYQIQKSSIIKSGEFQIYHFEDKSNQTKIVASGNLNLQDDFPPRKIAMYNPKGESLGQIFIECNQISKRVSIDSRITAVDSRVTAFKNIATHSTIDVPKFQRYQQNAQQSRMSLISRKSSSNLHSIESSRIKRMSVLNQNNEVVFPRQKRFKVYQDKQSDYISYLTNINKRLELRDYHSGRFIKGAALGYGQKTDFAKRGSPGVGQYKLPSIWDRY